MGTATKFKVRETESVGTATKFIVRETDKRKARNGFFGEVVIQKSFLTKISFSWKIHLIEV